MFLNRLTVVLVLAGLWVCPACEAKGIMFDAAPDPSLVYPGDRCATKEADHASESLPGQTQLSPYSIDKSSAVWKTWRDSIDKLIAERFTSVSGMFSHGPALHAAVKYFVGKDRQIKDVRFDQKSSNIMFNTAAQGVVNSLQDNPILQFPDGHDGTDVEMQANFDAVHRKYENWHDERDRVIQRVGDFKYEY